MADRIALPSPPTGDLAVGMGPDNLHRKQQMGMRASIAEGSMFYIWFNAVSGSFLTGFALYLGAGGFAIGVLSSLAAFATMLQVLCAPLVGKLHGRQKWMALFSGLQRVTVALAGLLALKLAPSHLALPLFVGLNIFAWVFQAPLSVIWQGYMTDLVPLPIRGRYLSKRAGLTLVFSVVATLAYGWILDRWPGATGFGFLYWGCMIGAVGDLLTWIWHKELPPGERPQTRPFWESFRAPLTRKGPHRPFALFLAAWALAQNLAVPFFAVQLVQKLQISFGMVALLTTLSSLAAIFTSTLWGRLQDRIGESKTIGILAVGLTVVPLLFLAGHTFGWAALILAHLLFGSFNNAMLLSQQTLIMRLAPADNRGSYFAFFASAGGLTGFLTPVLAGPFTTHYIGPLFVAAALLSAGLAVLWYGRLAKAVDGR
ncbi:MAG: MFS transporter [Mycobacterium leprae]